MGTSYLNNSYLEPNDMNPIKRLTIASSVTFLLSACGAGTGIDLKDVLPSVGDASTHESTQTSAEQQQNSAAEERQEETNQGTSSTSTTVQNSGSSNQNGTSGSTSNSENTQTAQPTTTPETTLELVDANIDGTTISKDYLDQVEAQLTNTDLMQSVKASIATLDNETVERIAPFNPSNPTNVKRVESILSENDWSYIFAERAPEYSYDKFLKAVGKFPAFCGDYTDGRDAEAICRKSLATMFAHFTQETGGHSAYWEVEEWRQGLVHVREMGWDESMRGGYNGECNPTVWQGQTWPCGTFDDGEFKSYFGRGAKQLSYNYNYGPFSEAMFGDVRVLLDNPEMVADTWLNLASAVFFYVYPQPPKPSMLHVIDGTWQPNARDISNGLTPGFGVTTQIINGGVECGGSTEIAQSLNRITYYQSFADYLGVTVPNDEVLGCAGMKQFDSTGAGALNIYWEQDWSYVAENPEGASYACKLVGYQTPFSAFKEGDYSRCVEHHFNVTAVAMD
jgi:chitodextrinase